jgi:hypothetical protein
MAALSLLLMSAAAAFSASSTANLRQAGLAAPETASSATRTGASAIATVSARIVRDSARIGAAFGAPAAGLVARPTTIATADGSAVPALVYDFQ